jgi:hypothetical protein
MKKLFFEEDLFEILFVMTSTGILSNILQKRPQNGKGLSQLKRFEDPVWNSNREVWLIDII